MSRWLSEAGVIWAVLCLTLILDLEAAKGGRNAYGEDGTRYGVSKMNHGSRSGETNYGAGGGKTNYGAGGGKTNYGAGGGKTSYGRGDRVHFDPFASCGRPVLPKNARIIDCYTERDYKTCIVRCNPGYEFQNNLREWQTMCPIDGTTWSPSSTPTCVTAKGHGGYDIPPNIQDGSMGNIHETEEFLEPCLDPPIPPYSTMMCHKTFENGKKCIVTCYQGYFLPDRAESFQTECFSHSNRWMPSLKLARCTRGSTGDINTDGSCQHPPTGMNMGYSCKKSYDGTMTCNGSCFSDFHFANTQSVTTMVLSCKSGKWTPLDKFPDCIRGSTGDINTSGSCHRPLTGTNMGYSCKKSYDGTMTCNGSCLSDFHFANTRSVTTMVLSCKSGKWTPLDKFPDCISSYPSCSAAKAPINGIVNCSFTGGRSNMICTGRCFSGGKFSDGSSEKVLSCKKGKWENGDRFPSCIKGGHYGDSTTFDMCKEPPSPLNGWSFCSKAGTEKKCLAYCNMRYGFEHGGNREEIICKLNDGKWSPKSFSNCKRICEPECLNGGHCTETGICLCPASYRGAQCQYSTENCDEKNIQFFGTVKCNHLSNVSTCELGCEEGFYLDASTNIITCDLEGNFSPSIPPKCKRKSSHGTDLIASGSETDERTQTETDRGIFDQEQGVDEYGEKGPPFQLATLESTGVCAVWSTYHYRTFDGYIYDYAGSCSYILAKDFLTKVFSITLEHDKNCVNRGVRSGTKCYRTMKIMLADKVYQLYAGPNGAVLSENGRHLPLPYSQGITVEYIGRYTVATLYQDTTVWMDGTDAIYIVVSKQFKGGLQGLCGNYDDNHNNDMMKPNGALASNVISFGNSWKVQEAVGVCEDVVENAYIDACRHDSAKDDKIAEKAAARCLNINEYKYCHQFVRPEIYIEACKVDCCDQKAQEGCECSSLAEYFRECARLNINRHTTWRKPALCPMKCENGTEYQDCGSACPKTCGAPDIPCKIKACVDGCHCPEGMALHQGQCLPLNECPCQHNDYWYTHGTSLQINCKKCLCQGGNWECTENICPAVCSSVGDSHFTTFDGKHYNFVGYCSYYLVHQDNGYIVEQENSDCVSDSGEYESASHKEPIISCKKTVILKTPQGTVIKLKHGMEISVNGKEVTYIPRLAPGVSIRQLTSVYQEVEFSNGLKVLWDGWKRIYVIAPPSLYGKVQGLCGTYNNLQNDDFITPAGDQEKSVKYFAEKWRVPNGCHDILSPHILVSSPCDYYARFQKEAENICSKLKNEVFKDCKALVDPEPFYKNCMYDVCSCKSEISSCFCSSLADYALICARNNVSVDWRRHVPSCGLRCLGQQQYQTYHKSCEYSCHQIAVLPECEAEYIEGCACPSGEALDANGNCISVAECPCIYNNYEYPPRFVQRRGMETCTCVRGQWQCRTSSLDELITTPSSDMLCLAAENKEYTECMSDCPLTCSNLHDPPSCTMLSCKQGCSCKQGYVLNEVNGNCVLPKDCPCHHGKRSYKDKEKIRIDCKWCTCRKGYWECDKVDCPGVCSAWGNSHFMTFDGHFYDFQGSCEYVLASGKITNKDTFSIVIQNEKCGGNGITCSKTVSFSIGSDTITFLKNGPFPKVNPGSPFSIREVGIFVYVTTDIGISLQWDKGTRIYVLALPTWSGKLKGLCGDFNGDSIDDFKQPSGNIPATQAVDFANSWKMHSYCERPLDIPETCVFHSERREWAIEKCKILKSSVFSECHSEVDLEPYHESCVFDACACDMGGDCECLCTAIAAYAYECARNGIYIYWRSQELCPIQCEDCDHYSPCISTCPPETCETEGTDIEEKTCREEPCSEGCERNACPRGQIFNNTVDYKCIPVEECSMYKPPSTCEHKGIIYTESERIDDPELSDKCRTCYCTWKGILCSGHPCVTSSYEETEETVTTEKHCISGWSTWFSVSSPNFKEIYDSLCPDYDINDIECHPKDDECVFEDMLNCLREEYRTTSICKKHEIRVHCDCGDYEKVVGNHTEEPPYEVGEETPGICGLPMFTDWMTINSAEINTLQELISKLRGSYSFCDDKDILSVQCDTSKKGGISHRNRGNIKKCINPKGVLICGTNGQYDKVCKVRILCNCMIKDLELPKVKCLEETPWINFDKPDDGFDFESLHRIPAITKLCPKITATRCRELPSNSSSPPPRSPYNIQCVGGEVACKTDSKHTCGDYAIRSFCKCKKPPRPTPKTSRTQSTSACPPGSLWDECAIDCESTCEPFRKQLLSQGRCTDKNKCVAGCRKVECSPPRLWRDSQTCVLEYECPCTTDTGEVVGPNSLVKKDCETCHCLNGKLSCLPIPGCATNESGSLQNYTGENVVQEDCWTRWLNLDSPDTGAGDFEKLSTLQREFKFCSSPIEVQCRNAITKIDAKDSNEDVKCDKTEGLACWNRRTLCSDYEIRFFCPCPGITSSPKPETTPMLPEVCQQGWSLWYNSHIPDEVGDRDNLQLVEENIGGKICIGGAVTSVKCRRKEDGSSYHLTNQYVTCDTEKGLRCDNSRQNKGEKCDDYEISFFCDCFEKGTTQTTPQPEYSFSTESVPAIVGEGGGISGFGYTTPVPTVAPPCAEFIPLINGETKLPDSNLKVTSKRSEEFGAPSLRIPPEAKRKAWIPATGNKNQYVEIDLAEPRLIYGIITQGREDYEEWVTSYRLSYSNDGLLFTEYRDPRNKRKVISGNYDNENLVKVIFEVPFEARYVKIQPNTWEGQIALRVELLGCSKTAIGTEESKKLVCLDPMGLENGKLSDAQMTASSYFDWSHTASDGRIGGNGWVAGYTDSKQYLEIDFLEKRNLSAIITQGREKENQWVSAFMVSYSNDGNTWTVISDEYENTIKVFPGNYDSEHLVTNYFPRSLRTRYLKIIPVQWKNWISMKVEVLGCYHKYPDVITSTAGEVIYASPTEQGIPTCLQPMGLSYPSYDSKALPDNLINVSSSVRGADASRLRLNTKAEGAKKGGWVPRWDDDNPSVQIDFLTPSVLTAITTKGIEGTNRWISSYKVSVSNDTKLWQSVYSDGSDIFEGNKDGNTAVTNMFDRPMKARYFKLDIIPSRRSLLGLRMEVFGCYHAYEALPTSPIPPAGGAEEEESCIMYGPWKSLSVPDKPYSEGDFENIKEIIAESNTCPNPIDIECRAYASHTNYKNTGQNVTCDLTRGLSCWNKDQKNGICYNYEVRIKCWTCKMEENQTSIPPGLFLCPELPKHLAEKCSVCPNNMLCDGINCIDKTKCPCFRGNKKFLPGHKIITEKCEECQCALGGHSQCYKKSCDPCPLGQRTKLLPDCSCICESCSQGERLCPTSKECISEEHWCDGIEDCPDDEISCPTKSSLPGVVTSPPLFPLENRTCELLGKRIRTVDGQEIDYEICDHVMVLDAQNSNFNITVKKTCSQNPTTCQKIYLVQHDETLVSVDSDTEVMINGNYYTASQLVVYNKRNPDITVEIVGNHVYVKSKVYGFTVIRDQNANLKVEVSAKLKNQILGLCGFYNGKFIDDKMKPDGTTAATSKEFGDSWANNGTKECISTTCSEEFGEQTVEICKMLREDPFDVCKDYLNVESYVQACVSSTCECMMENGDKISECKCAAFLPLLEACENKLHRPLSKWRSKHGCAPPCAAGFVWEDCGSGCQQTCDNINSQEQEETCLETCIPGCFCPAGTVLNGRKCVLPEECSNAQCQGFGDPHFSTFDGWYYPFQAAGRFILATDTKKTFEIEGKSGQCSPNHNGTCLSALTVSYRGNVVKIEKGKPITVGYKAVTMDMLPLELNGITILGFPGPVYLVVIPSLSIIVRYYEIDDGFSINIPPERFYNNTRGLCGNCNGKKDDEMIPAYKMIMKGVSDFVCSWIKEGSFSQCKKSYREKSILTVEDTCPELLESTFGACHPLVDPTLYQQSCSYDVSSSTDRHSAVCKSLMEYARQCCEAGVVLSDWFIKYKCVMPCPNGMVYHHCHDACPQTCQNKSENVDCHDLKVDGCFCPGNMVLKDGVCVDEIYCKLPEECSYTAEFVIDKTGSEIFLSPDERKPAQYKVGESWNDGYCRNCTCKENNGQIIPICSDAVCPDHGKSQEHADYVLVTSTLPGQCCPEIFHSACKDEDGNIKEIGEKWKNKTDPCHEFECAFSVEVYASKISRNVECECKEYEEQQPPAENECCGKCVKKYCTVEDKLYSVGDQWTKGCLIGECEEENGKVIETFQSNCSVVPDSCPKENIIWDVNHCCEICNATIGAVGCNTIQQDFKVGDFEEEIGNHGKCVNTKPLAAIKKCVGICESESMYYLENGEPATSCKCCSPVDIQVTDVELKCDDGTNQTFKLKHPISCKCSPCAASAKAGISSSGETESQNIQRYEKLSQEQNAYQQSYQQQST